MNNLLGFFIYDDSNILDHLRIQYSFLFVIFILKIYSRIIVLTF